MLYLWLVGCVGPGGDTPAEKTTTEPTTSVEPIPSTAVDDTSVVTDDSDTPPPDDSGTIPDDSGTPPAAPIVRFVVMGDGGEGNDDQYAVSGRIEEVCAAKTDDHPGCSFALYLGDNFYDDGVSGVKDDQFQSKFELPYANLDFPFYVVLGNHDYGEWSILEYKAAFEVEYTAYSDKWRLPDYFYSFNVEHVHFLGLDTNRIMLESLWGDSGQADWVADEMASSSSDWHIAFGHHPYRSNGAHGNAGEYEGYEWLPIANGATIENFMESSLCGAMDVYFCGHDHNRQWLEPTCGMELLVSGAAAKTTDLEDRGNATAFEDDTVEGFLWVEIEGDRFHGEFWNKDGTMDYVQEFTRAR